MNARENWLQQRRSGIGGSDCPVVLGLSPHKSPYRLYMEKRGEIPGDQPDNASMLWGRVLEPVIREQYVERTGRTVSFDMPIIKNEKFPFMLATVDGLTTDGRVLEIKTARGGSEWGEEGTDQIPENYLLQTQHYMAVTGLHVTDVAVLIGGSDFRIYEVPANYELQEMIIEAEAEFWESVTTGRPPAITSYADASLRYGKSVRTGKLEASVEALEAFNLLKSVKAKYTELEELEDQAKALITAELGEEFDTLVSSGKVLATWKAPKPSKRLDTKAFKAALPEIFDKFAQFDEPSRRFLLK